MIHKHFTTIDSTQKYLKENLSELIELDKNILISTYSQTSGVGRNGNIWSSQTNSLALSFTLKPNNKPSLTPLEIGILCIKFLKEKYNSKCYLKWPNDLLGQTKSKCGGILTQYIDQNLCISGIGINLGKIESPIIDSTFKHGLEEINQSLVINDEMNKIISNELYQYILLNRLDDFKVIEEFRTVCGHLNSTVIIDDDSTQEEGIFTGISDFGEAVILQNGIEKKYLSSSLKIIN